MKQAVNFKYNNTVSTMENFFTQSSADNNYFDINSFVSEDHICNDNQVEEKGKYSIFDIANWFLLKGNMTHKKLQKLCYYAQAWSYALNGYRLCNTDFQAWTHGPVSPALYEKFKGFGFDTIEIKTKIIPAIEKKDNQLLEDIWDTYGDKTGNALEALSHREAPWQEARIGYKENEKCTVVITPQSMKKYYKSIFSGEI